MSRKILFTLLLLFYNIVFAQDIKLYLKDDIVKNGQTTAIFLEAETIYEPKLTIDKQNINFFKYQNKANTYYALIPISYYKSAGDYRVIVSFLKNGKKEFKGITLKVQRKKYESEVINVAKGKVSLSEKNKKRTKKEYASAMKTYNTITKETLANKEYIYPLNSKITSDFGKKRVYNGLFRSYHSGTDFKAKIGTPIKATNDGIIAIAEDRFYAGNSIVINHGQGLYSCYFHLSKMNFKVGEKVKKGEIIGLGGNTGRVTGPHLHFATRVHGIQVDPVQLIDLLNSI